MAVGAALAALVLAPSAQAAAPGGAVDGWRSPADQTLVLTVHGVAASGGALGDAVIALDGMPLQHAALCDPAGSCSVGTATLSFHTTGLADGTYHMQVLVYDVDGTPGTALDAPDFEIWNHRPTYSSTATLSVGSTVPELGGGQPGSQTGGSGGGVHGAIAGSCTSPKLSMVLHQRPLRIRRGVPVVVAGKRYRFTGRLTCVIDGRRHSAPKRTRIDVRAIVHGRSVPKARASVGSGGKVVFRLASPSSRTLEFRFTGRDGKVTRVRIRIVTVRAPSRQKG